MPKARQQYLADEVSLNKEGRVFALDDELLQKIEDMDVGEENVIEVVKVNSTPLPVDGNKAVNVVVPLVQDSLDSIDPNKSLSARQGKILYDYILNLQNRGRFLSNWNAENGVPVTTPFGDPYTYNAGDYYVVTVVSNGGTNYRPDGAVYDSQQTIATPETEQLDVSDMYVYDGSQWLLQKNSSRQIAVDPSLSTTSTNPVENRVITNELNNKQNKLIPGANIQIDQNTNTISATGYSNLPAAQGGTDNTLVTTGDKYNWDNKQDSLQAGANIQINGNVISATNTTYGNLPEAEGGTSDTLVTTGDKYNWNHKQDGLTPGQNITISNGVISATDTTYSAGTGITIDNNNVISAHDVNATWGNITGDINNQTDLINILNGKQDALTPGENINITNGVISATDTKYTAGNGISINSNNEISNVKQFNPQNLGQEGQILKKTSEGYRWENEGGGGGGASVDNTPFGPTWDGITGVAPSKNAVYDKISAMDITIAGKQDQLVAGQNIQINGNVISATDTKYTAADFDIKDLADSSNLRNTWNNKQDKINDLQTIRDGAAKGATALQPGDNVSKLVNDAGYITKAISDLNNYYTKNQTYTKTEVDALIANFAGFKVVSSLPITDIKTTLIYLLGPSANNTYEEYVYIDNQWVKIGETSMDLTNYFHKTNDDSDDIIEGSTHLFMTPAERINLSHQSGTNTGDETQASIQNKLGVATSTKSGYLSSGDWNIFNNKQDKLVAGQNIQINGNVISATTGSTYSAGDYINIDSNNVISNTKPFIPANTGSAGQVLTKTSGGYRWQTGSGGGVSSVNGMTGDVTIEEFSPGSGTSGQILRKGGGNSYYWDDESGGGGGGVSSVNGKTGAVTVNEVPSGGSTGQILTKTSNGYDWQASSAEQEVRVWNIPQGGFSQEEMREIMLWCLDAGEFGRSAILKFEQGIGKDVFVYGFRDTAGGVSSYYFMGTWIGRTTTRSANGDYTTMWHTAYVIQYDGNTFTSDYINYDIAGNYLSITPDDYQTAFTPQYAYQPATKQYVDSAVAAGPSHVGGITSNATGTTYTAQQIWVGTQAQYNALGSYQNGVIYNIISS